LYLIQTVKKFVRKLGFDVVRYPAAEIYPTDIAKSVVETYKHVKTYTMTSPERIYSLCEAVKYIHEKSIEGDIVECGVWKGGSMMAVAETLLRMSDSSRHLYLFDTFEGMNPPTDKDVDFSGVAAERLLENSDKDNDESVWCRASLDVVKEALGRTGYPSEKMHFVKGMVEETIPINAPDKIALLRLDTDWYESTRHELEHLFPRLAKGGVLIIDDYGHWQGARKAVDEYLEINGIKMLLNRVDYTGRIAVKVD
jgi:O-methyltransferase